MNKPENQAEKKKKHKRIRPSHVLIWVIAIIITAFSLFPFYYMVILGTYETNQMYHGFHFLPGNYLMHNLELVFSRGFLRFYWNSFYVGVISTVLAVVSSALAGFALSKYEFRGRKFAMKFVLLTLLLPGGISIIGFVQEMKAMHLLNTHWALILPWLNLPFGAYLMTQFMQDSVPTEILESARIDGCSEPGIFVRIALPLLKPAVATLSVTAFIWSWNSYLTPSVVLNDRNLFTVPLGLVTLRSQYENNQAAQVLAMAIGTIPVLVLFLCNSKAFLRGLTMGSVKG